MLVRLSVPSSVRGSAVRSVLRSFSSTTAVTEAKSLSVDNPYTGDTYCKVPLSRPEEMDSLLEKATAAQKTWQTVPLEERMDVCRKFIDFVVANQDDVAKDITGQMGKPLGQAKGEVNGLVERANKMIEFAPAALADVDIDDPDAAIVRRITREPVGVVLCISPWNYPLMTAVNTVVPAILAGNSVVLKMSPRTPLCSTTVFQAGFAAAGAPDGVLNPLNCSHAVVNRAIQDSRVGFVSFTGSTDGGAIVNNVASSRFIDVTLELGGKDAAYVAPDADLAAAVDGIVDGAMYNAGQSCCAMERVYVHSSLYDDFVDAALAQVLQYRQGDPMDPETTMGPMALPTATAFLKEQVDEATEKGARLLCGGKPTTDAAGLGRFFAPTLLADCDHSMSVMLEESFGPLLAMTPVDTDEEAVRLMNDSPYGLTAAVFTGDLDRVAAMGSALSVGTVFQNRCDYLDPSLAWTSRKDSGKGVSLSQFGFDSVTRLKSWNMRRKST